MPDAPRGRPDLRHERLAAIVAEHGSAIRDPRTACAFVAPAGATPRFAAVVSEEPRISEQPVGGATLLVAESIAALGALMDRECRRGRRAYERIWDLDAPCDATGNLDAAHRASVLGDRDPSIYRVEVAGREEGSYFFDHPHDAEDFFDAVRRRGERAELGEELLHDRLEADVLIGAEMAPLDTSANMCSQCRGRPTVAITSSGSSTARSPEAIPDSP